MWSFIHPHVVPNLFDFLYEKKLYENIWKTFENVANQTISVTFDFDCTVKNIYNRKSMLANHILFCVSQKKVGHTG